MNNARIAEQFELVADLLEFQNANPFRVRAYRNGARAIRDLQQSLVTLVQQPDTDLTKIAGIGKDLATKCLELIENGELALLNDLRAEVPESVLQLLRIPGLGPKKAALLYHELGIVDLEKLQTACEAGQVRRLKGFGPKTEKTILEGLSFAETASARLRWADADSVVQELVEHLRATAGLEQLEPAGSYRRGKETVGDVDLLAVAADPTAVMDRLAEFPGLEASVARGDTKMSIRVQRGLQVDLRVVPRESFGAALQYFTGSKEHNVEVRGRARQRGLKINEYGVYRVDGQQQTLVAGETEAGVYAAIGLPAFPPELREARREFEWADAGELPRLIELSDLHGDLHMHTTASDGKADLREMVTAAHARGLSYIAITDHSPRVTMANGLNGERLRAQWREIERLNEELGSDFRVLKGVECDILESGDLDLPDDVLAEADWVVASVHYGQHQSRQQITDRILGAIEHPSIAAIAHPTGRLINRRAAYDVDIDAVIRAAARHRKLLELNANPYRLDLNDVHCAAAKAMGVPIVINSDAHSSQGLQVLRYGVMQARRAGLTAQDVANCRPWSEFSDYLSK